MKLLKSNIVWIVIGTIIFISGCATAKGVLFSKVETDGEYSIVYFYRKDLGYWQSAYSPKVIVNNSNVVTMPKNAFALIKLNPGKHEFLFKHNPMAGYTQKALAIETLPNKIYYIRIADPIEGFKTAPTQSGLIGDYKTYFDFVDEEIALKEILNTRKVEFNKTN